jgi:hypothetical protein
VYDARRRFPRERLQLRELLGVEAVGLDVVLEVIQDVCQDLAELRDLL